MGTSINYPNPTSGILKIDNISSSKYKEDMEIRVYDTLGREVKTYKRLDGILPEEIWLIHIEDLPAGMYLFRVSDKYQENTFKIVKV